MNDTLNQMELTDIRRAFCPKAAEYMLFSRARGTSSRIDHIVGHKSGINKHKKTEIIPCIFPGHSAMKLEVNCKKKFGRTTKTWRLKNTLLKNEWVNQEIKEELKTYIEANENENTTAQTLWDAKVVLKREVYSVIGLPQETRKISNIPPTLTPKGAGERTADKA